MPACRTWLCHLHGCELLHQLLCVQQCQLHHKLQQASQGRRAAAASAHLAHRVTKQQAQAGRRVRSASGGSACIRRVCRCRV